MGVTNLQIPMSKDLKEKAAAAAAKEGFSSLQEFVRVILTKLSNEEISLRIDSTVRLSAKNEKRYAKMDEDFKKAKNVFVANSVEELFEDLAS